VGATFKNAFIMRNTKKMRLLKTAVNLPLTYPIEKDTITCYDININLSEVWKYG